MDSLLLPPVELDTLTSAGRQSLHDDLRRGWHVKHALAVMRQDRIKTAFEEAGPQHSEPFGQLTMVVDPVLYEAMRHEHGAECWRDPDFRKAFERHNPQCSIRSRSRRMALRVDGLRSREQGAGGREPEPAAPRSLLPAPCSLLP